LLSRARKQAAMACRASEEMKIWARKRYVLIGEDADEAETALEQSSPSASLVRNARLNR
jgi:hypothetical protein